MTRKMWWIGGVSLVVLIAIAAVSLRSTLDLKHAERSVETQKTAAEEAEAAAGELEKKQSEQRAKIEYLEEELETLREEARRKDEELERNDVGVRDARDRVERLRRTRTIDQGVDELCRRLDELGHGCEEK